MANVVFGEKWPVLVSGGEYKPVRVCLEPGFVSFVSSFLAVQ